MILLITKFRWFRGDNQDIRPELHEIEKSLSDSEGLKWSDLRQRAILKPVIISVTLMIFQQTSGINVFIFYGVSIIQNIGISGGYSVKLYE